VTERPGGGETTIARDLVKQPGGKGANQAAAAARLGGSVHFVGAVGRDDDGASILRSLQKDGASIDDVRIVDGEPTGLALILVDDRGENSITVVSGANATVTPERASGIVRRLGGPSAIVVVQGELRVDVLEETARTASAVGARVIVNLAPYCEIAPDVLGLADPLVVNESEAAQLVGFPISGVDDALRALEVVRPRVRSVVITLGALGAVWEGAASREPSHVAAAAATDVVDTTGAGDAFVGALAFALSTSDDLGPAVELGARAGTFAIRGVGAQSSYARAADLGLADGR
jgi:ribokinase